MNNQNHQQTGSGLTRYRSAPSSYFADLLNSGDDLGVGFGAGVEADEFEQLFNPPETNRIFSIQELNNYPSQLNSQFYEPPEKLLRKQSSNDYSSSSQFMYHPPIDIKIEGRDGGGGGGSGGGGSSSLIRHSSSPAGLFANINIEKEFGATKGMGFSSRHMATISEIESKGTRESSPGDHVQFNEVMNSWEDSSILHPDHQNNEGGKRPATLLSHHLSLPKSSTTTEFSSMENLLKDSVPWKIRAKRGFATHPRSIAERVRRTKISERMRKLQELVPNMEKQTNTADMLDLAVDYIKDLQTQVKKLADNREKCSCLAKGKS